MYFNYDFICNRFYIYKDSNVKKLEKMSGGEAMVRAAKANGIDTVFGLPGAQTYPIFDALYKQSDIKTVITRHEQGAGYMAYGYSKATGKPGAFSVVPGPGVLNTTAAKSAIMDADYAAETTELARTQIISQASTAMLSQANQQAQSILALLK